MTNFAEETIKLGSTNSSKHFSRVFLNDLPDWNSQSKLHLEKKEYSRKHGVRVLKDLPSKSQSRVLNIQTAVKCPKKP